MYIVLLKSDESLSTYEKVLTAIENLLVVRFRQNFKISLIDCQKYYGEQNSLFYVKNVEGQGWDQIRAWNKHVMSQYLTSWFSCQDLESSWISCQDLGFFSFVVKILHSLDFLPRSWQLFLPRNPRKIKILPRNPRLLQWNSEKKITVVLITIN